MVDRGQRVVHLLGRGDRIVGSQVGREIGGFVDFRDVAADAVVLILHVVLGGRLLRCRVHRLHADALVGQGGGVHALEALDRRTVGTLAVLGAPHLAGR